MIRVGDLQESIKFYTDILGMKLLRQKNYPSGRFTLAFIGYGSEEENAVIELTYNWDTKNYSIGDGFGHIALGVKDINETCNQIRKSGGTITREPGPMKHGKTIIAFVEDPDGYKIELIDISSRDC